MDAPEGMSGRAGGYEWTRRRVKMAVYRWTAAMYFVHYEGNHRAIQRRRAPL